MSYCARKGSIVREVWVDVNRIEIAGNIRVRLVGERRIENGGAFRGCQSVAVVGQSGQLTLSNDGVAFTVILLEINCSDLDQPLELIADENVAGYRDIPVLSFVLESDLGLDPENKSRTSLRWRQLVVPLKPLFRL